MSEPNGISDKKRAPWGRLAVTVAAALIVWRLPPIAIPGVDATEIARRSEGLSGFFHVVAPRSISVFALGIMPYLSASWVVELAALAVPAWRPLRHGGPKGRQRLGRAVLAVTLALCVSQSFAMARMLEGMALTESIGSVSIPIVMLTLTAGAFLLGILAETAGAYGLAGGFALISITFQLIAPLEAIASRALAGAARVELGLFAAFAAFVAGATAFVLRPPPENGATTKEPTYRAAPEERARGVAIPPPSSGIVPLAVTATILSTAMLQNLGLPTERLFALVNRDRIYYIGAAVVVVASAFVVARLFHAPERLAVLAARARGDEAAVAGLAAEARDRLRESTLRSVLYVAALLVAGEACWRLAGTASIAVPVALGTALALDIAAELRARREVPGLVAIWPEHRPYAVGPARQALDEAGIPMFARGERVRRLLQFFGPYAPIDLMVSREHAERATEILSRVLLPRGEDGRVEEEARAGARRAPRRRFTRTEAVMAGLTLTIVAAVAFVPVVRTAEAPRRPVRSDVVALLALDDEADPLAELAGSKAPAGVRIEVENAPLGPGKTAVRHFARMTRRTGETLDDTRARMTAWLTTVSAPEGARFALGQDTEWDEVNQRLEGVGWRTYLVKPDVVLGGAEVADVRVRVERDEGPAPGGAVLDLKLTETGAEAFRAFTANHVMRRLAIVVNGRVVSAPQILGEIGGGLVQITMGMSGPDQQLEEARKLERELVGP
jgi:hypothetical protein